MTKHSDLQPDPLYSALVKTIFLVDDVNQRFFAHYDLSTTRFFALVHIADDPGLSMSTLSERLLCTKGNTTRVIRSLEEAGLIDRHEHDQDSRAFRLFITPQGEALLDELVPAYEDFSRQRFADFSETQKRAFLAYLELLNTHLESLKGLPQLEIEG